MAHYHILFNGLTPPNEPSATNAGRRGIRKELSWKSRTSREDAPAQGGTGVDCFSQRRRLRGKDPNSRRGSRLTEVKKRRVDRCPQEHRRKRTHIFAGLNMCFNRKRTWTERTGQGGGSRESRRSPDISFKGGSYSVLSSMGRTKELKRDGTQSKR